MSKFAVSERRTVWMDNLRVVATIAVIIIHVATPAVFTQFNVNNNHWWIGNVYASICRFCVPVFLMLTGALLLPQQQNLRTFLNKRFKRVLLPFIFWCFIYIAFNLALKVRDGGTSAALSNLPVWLYAQFTQAPAPHLWYIYMLIGLYLFIPVIQPWVVNASNKGILFFLAIWILTILVGQFSLVPSNSPLDLRYFSGYIGYVITGYFIAHRLSVTINVKLIAVFLFIAGVASTLLGTNKITQQAGAFSHAYYEYLTINVLCAAVGIFVLFKSLAASVNESAPSLLSKFVARYGYGIYLAHLLIISILSHFNIDYKLVTPVLGIPLTAVICMAISAGLVYIIHKLPYGKYFAG
ncbi:acyltransferase [Mucilaginibacter aquatilis]|uniref:Acyltransferase family protein n=1 Tax=Mucilaginibacter aquatilis TaxID=1517760 RepID=A0A6I4IAR1_9SPHI|nr:acyltransferase family protein [Mucilaginibacter aquatilis]MVN90606.1 acyltransferase family protein [Mucilaginibacter aquatilis]